MTYKIIKTIILSPILIACFPIWLLFNLLTSESWQEFKRGVKVWFWE